MKKLALIIGIIIALIAMFFAFNNYIYEQKQAPSGTTGIQTEINIIPISHATMILDWADKTIYIDPAGGAESFAGQAEPDLILITDIHGDHLNIETLETITGTKTIIVAPQAVFDQLTEDLKSRTTVLNNNEVINQNIFGIQAVPMYNLPETSDTKHAKGRGNGYIIENSGQRVYIAGDTDDTTEMRNLQDIDIAFIPMNPPYTMDITKAADAVLEFKPKKVYPYHYRTPEGFSDVNKFKELVNNDNSNIEVILLDWYPTSN